MEFPIPEGIDVEWWDAKTKRVTFNYCPTCEPDLDDRVIRMLDVKYCGVHTLVDKGDEEAESRITAPTLPQIPAG